LLKTVVSYLIRRTKLATPVWLGLGVHDIDHAVAEFPEVTIIIPTRDRIDILRPCLESIQTITSYPNYKVLVLDNDSEQPETLNYLADLASEKIQVLPTPGEFNYSKIINFGVASVKSGLVCLLNNDTLIQTPSWLTDLVSHLREPEVGLVGALLLYPNGLIQHAGIALGYRGLAGHVFSGTRPGIRVPATEHCFEVSAVTFACALMRKQLWNSLQGLDEAFKVGLNDVDFGTRAVAAGYKNVVCTCARVIHLESESRKSMKSLSGFGRAVLEVLRYSRSHPTESLIDPYFGFETE